MEGVSLKINEIFYSIQGESLLAGKPTVFIRTATCNLHDANTVIPAIPFGRARLRRSMRFSKKPANMGPAMSALRAASRSVSGG